MCLDFLCDFCLTFLNLRRNERDMIINIHRFSFKVPVILVIFQSYLGNMHFIDRFSNNPQILKFLEFVHGKPSSSMQTNGRADRQARWKRFAILQTLLKMSYLHFETHFNNFESNTWHMKFYIFRPMHRAVYMREWTLFVSITLSSTCF